LKTRYFCFATLSLFWALTVCAQQDTKPANAPVQISGTEAKQLLLQSAEAVYPEGPDDLKGLVVVILRIDINGNVVDVSAKSAAPELSAAAVAAFRQYKFKPYMVDGRPAECLILGTADFLGRAAGVKLALDLIKLRISQGVMDSNKIRDEQPVYPRVALAAHIQGDVLLRATISREGDITNLTVISGHPLLVNAALDAVQRWKYRPFWFKGKLVEVDTVITVKFHM
jgi:TonB family protein